jgi:pyruvate-formate lyase
MRTFAQKQNQPQKTESSSLARPNAATPRLNHRAELILHLQHTMGNQAVQRMLRIGRTHTFLHNLWEGVGT